MNSVKQENLARLEQVAKHLGDMVDDLVFLGGCTTALFITEEAAPDVRATLDVDCIVDVISRNEYHKLASKLTKQGFSQSMDDEVICRWRYDKIILDVMPTDEKILGFSNVWYKEAIAKAKKYPLSENIYIKAVTAPYFIATKLEAFKMRGNMDFYGSHDFEDIVSVIDGRPEVLEEIKQSDDTIREYIAGRFKEFYNNRAFLDALPGHFSVYGGIEEDRIDLFSEKIKGIIES